MGYCKTWWKTSQIVDALFGVRTTHYVWTPDIAPNHGKFGRKGPWDYCETVTELLTSRGRLLRYVPRTEMVNPAETVP